MKNGIALLITVALVAAISALISVSTGILDHSFKQTSNKRFLVQSNLFFSDLVSILNDAAKDVNDSVTLDLFLSVPLTFENREQDIGVEIVFASEATAVNVNRLLEGESNTSSAGSAVQEEIKLDALYEEYFDRILSVYNVSDKILLLSMVADSIDEDLDERTAGSEIALFAPEFHQGKIYDLSHFKQILEAYKKQTLDFSVDEIPWEKLIGFDNQKLDFNHIEPEVLALLAPTLMPEEINAYTVDRVEIYDSFDVLMLDPETKERLEKMGVTFYSPEVKGLMNLQSSGDRVRIAFSYDLSSHKVSNIELVN